MALVPIISQSWDTNSIFNPTRMNNIENNIAIAATAEGTEYSNGVSVKDKIDSVEAKSNPTELSISIVANNGYVESIGAYAYKIGKLLFFSLRDMRPIRGQTSDWVHIATISNWSSGIEGYTHIIAQASASSAFELSLRIGGDGRIYIYTPSTLNGSQIFRGQVFAIANNF